MIVLIILFYGADNVYNHDSFQVQFVIVFLFFLFTPIRQTYSPAINPRNMIPFPGDRILTVSGRKVCGEMGCFVRIILVVLV